MKGPGDPPDGNVPASDDEAYAALRTAVAARALERDVLRVAGPDAESYLQGQLSQDVAGLGEGEARESLLLSPQGRIDAYLRVGRIGPDEFVVDVEGGFGPTTLERLVRFRLRTKVELELLDWACTGLRGPASGQAAAGGAVLSVPASWPGLPGVDVLGPVPPEVAGLPFADVGVPECGTGPWEAARIESGRPVQGREIGERTIAAEVGLVERTVSFTKGCFTGQELVARLDARGSKVARRLSGLVAERSVTEASALVGAAVWSEGPEAREVGAVTSAAWSPGLGSAVGLAVLHRSVEPPARVTLRTGSDADPLPAEARPLPLVDAR